MIRRLLAFGVAVAVQAGAVCAPFIHAHPGEDHDAHHSTPVHAHFSSHAPARAAHDGITVDHPDQDRAIYLQVFVAVEAASFAVPVPPPAHFELTAPPERPAHVTVEVAHGLDPPLGAALDSRPPPHLPVLI